jgi:minor curlin subunit
MTLRTLLITGAAALAMTAAFTPAQAGSYMSVEQYGAHNSFGSAQHGRRNRLTLYQNGYTNDAIGTQTGARNRVVIGQQGRWNGANATQFGRGNIVGIAQFGRRHTASPARTATATRSA